MLIDKSGINSEDEEIAIKLLKKLRQGHKMFGNPAEGLKITLKQLNSEEKKRKKGPTEWVVADADLAGNIAKLNSGIKGEETLARYLAKIIKNNEKLDGLIVFASLSFEQENNDKDYIPDTDFLCVYGKSLLIIDAKNINTNPQIPIYPEKTPDGRWALIAMGRTLIELNPSTFVWRNILSSLNFEYEAIDGCCCIVNKRGAAIFHNKDWYECECRPVYIGEIEKYLEGFVEGSNIKEASLELLTQITKTQILKEKSDMDLKAAEKLFQL